MDNSGLVRDDERPDQMSIYRMQYTGRGYFQPKTSALALKRSRASNQQRRAYSVFDSSDLTTVKNIAASMQRVRCVALLVLFRAERIRRIEQWHPLFVICWRLA